MLYAVFFLISLCKCPVITYKLQTHEAYTSESICPFNVSALGLACRLRKPNKRGRWSRSCVYIHLSPQVTFSGLGHFKKYHKRMQGTIHRKVVIMPSFSSSKRADTVKLAISGTLAAQLTRRSLRILASLPPCCGDVKVTGTSYSSGNCFRFDLTIDTCHGLAVLFTRLRTTFQIIPIASAAVERAGSTDVNAKGNWRSGIVGASLITRVLPRRLL